MMGEHFQVPFSADLTISCCGLVGHSTNPKWKKVTCGRCKRTKIFKLAKRADGIYLHNPIKKQLMKAVEKYLDSRLW